MTNTATYQAETARYEAVVDAATAEAWGSLWASPCDSVYLYYVASLPGAPGRMLALREGTPIPEGAELATSERLSPAFTREQLRRRVWELGRWLPIL